MSFDLHVWSVKQPSLPLDLPRSEDWVRQGSSWVQASGRWQIVVSEPVAAETEDLPDGASALIPGLSWLTSMNLEPIAAPRSAHSLALRTARQLAKAAHGVIENPQEDSLETPAGVRRYNSARSTATDRISILELSWYAQQGSPLSTRDGLDQLLDCMAAQLPEALPRRYGLFEPPQFRFSAESRDHFLDLTFSEENTLDSVVWYPHRPVVWVSRGGGPSSLDRKGFRADYLQIGIDVEALGQPGWCRCLERFWNTVALLIRPFFADARTLKNHLRNGSDALTEHGPVRGPWWKGIPSDLGHAAILGPPYLDLWPAFNAAAEPLGELRVVSVESWADGATIAQVVGPVPNEIAQPQKDDPERYPPIFPFGAFGATGS